MQGKTSYKNRNWFIINILCVVLFITSFPYGSNAQNIDSLNLQKPDSLATASISTDTLGIKQSDTTAYVKPDSVDLAKLVELKIQGEEELIAQMYDSLWVASGYKLLPLDSLNLQNLAFPPIVYTKK